MDRISILGMIEDQEDIFEYLMRVGAVELVSPSSDADSEGSEDIGQSTSAEAVSGEAAVVQLEQEIARLEQVLVQLNRRYPDSAEDDSLTMTTEEFLRIGSQKALILAFLARGERLLEREAAIGHEIRDIEQRLILLQPWKNIPIDFDAMETANTVLFAGSFSDRERMRELIATLEEELPETHIHPVEDTGDDVLALVVALKKNRALVEAKLSSAQFHPLPDQQAHGTPARRIADLQGRQNKLNDDLRKLDLDLTEIAERRTDFRKLADFLRVRRDRLSADEQLVQTASTFSLTGWIPAKRSEKVRKTLTERFLTAVDVRPARKDEDYPVQLRNNPFARAYEVILEMFGAPSPHEADPTPVMAPFYFIFFGMMLSDVGYGLLLTVLCAYLLFVKKATGELGKLSRMLFLSGISSVIWGFVFGGFFGNLVPMLTDGNASFPCLWFDPMEDPMKLMVWSMLFGVVHLFAGMLLDIYNQARRGTLRDALLDTAPWFVIIIGLGLMLTDFATVGKYMAIAGTAVKLLFGGREAKNPILRIFKGLASLYDITGYFSDILSYTRILALVLATSVIAIVVNTLAMIGGSGLLGIMLFIAVSIFGHLLNLALSALSAYVHAARLQYVEFFGKFFGGGGTFWKPLALRTRYVRLVDSEHPR